jgi:beta-glucosidase/6-phospho-beta-glucosidase/beta-galactosidase
LRTKGCDFKSFFLGGFECSTHRLLSGRRLDLIRATRHDQFVDADYRRLRSVGIETARDGVRWHLVEPSPRRYDYSSVLPMLRAARRNGIQVIWDLCHYGWPDDIDIFRPEFVNRFIAFVRDFAHVAASETDGVPYFTPINEVSFFSWAGGDMGLLNPFEKGRGDELKEQLVRATLGAIDAIRSVDRRARIVQVDPLVNIITEPSMPFHEIARAEAHAKAVYDAWDMVAGRYMPELGGSEEHLDIVGANYYVHNQWIQGGKFVERTHPRYRPLHELLAELYRRFRRPIFIAETGIEDNRRREWLAYVCDEVVTAIRSGIPIEGICLYPVVNHPGWEDERHCHNGLWDYCNQYGDREIYSPLADELARQTVRIAQVLSDLENERNSVGVFV